MMITQEKNKDQNTIVEAENEDKELFPMTTVFEAGFVVVAEAPVDLPPDVPFGIIILTKGPSNVPAPIWIPSWILLSV